MLTAKYYRFSLVVDAEVTEVSGDEIGEIVVVEILSLP
jgi:hypothetical protein